MERELSKIEIKAISALKRLSKNWPEQLQLFAASGTLCIVDIKTGQIFATIPNILCDGGDPDVVNLNGVEFFEHLFHP